ncbi:MAG: 30S ribosome-binding factor RbfA [Candidatus Omnitrophica bacterium]|nr:30S ribosome-binding factor RbfA [Candidatus Omnitrophota bacterium]
MSRAEKVSGALKKEIGSIIQTELKDPRLGFVTVMRVELSDDMRYGRVFFSVLGSAEEQKKSVEALESAAGFIRKLVAERIELRYVPELRYILDTSCEYSIHIQEELDKIKEEDEHRKSDQGDK